MLSTYISRNAGLWGIVVQFSSDFAVMSPDFCFIFENSNSLRSDIFLFNFSCNVIVSPLPSDLHAGSVSAVSLLSIKGTMPARSDGGLMRKARVPAAFSRLS